MIYDYRLKLKCQAFFEKQLQQDQNNLLNQIFPSLMMHKNLYFFLYFMGCYLLGRGCWIFLTANVIV